MVGRGLNRESEKIGPMMSQTEQPGRTSEKIHGCCERGHEDPWSKSGGGLRQAEMKADNPLWRPLKAAEGEGKTKPAVAKQTYVGAK